MRKKKKIQIENNFKCLNFFFLNYYYFFVFFFFAGEFGNCPKIKRGGQSKGERTEECIEKFVLRKTQE